MDGTQQILAAIQNINQDFGSKLTDLKTSMEEMETRINKNMYETINNRFESMQLEVDQLNSKNNEQNLKIEKLERQLRQRNLVLFGVAEEEKTYNDLEKLAIGIFMGQMDVECSTRDIQFLRRLGPKKENKSRPILVTLVTMGKKIEILQNKIKLNSTTCYIKEDFPRNVLEKRKELQKEVTKYKEEGIKAVIKYDKLIIISKNNKRTLPSSPQKETEKEASLESTLQALPAKSPSYEQVNKKNKITAKQSPKGQRSIATFVQSRSYNNKQDSQNITREPSTANKQRKSNN